MTEIYVKVETGQEEFDVETGHMLQVSLTQEAENNRANSELRERLGRVLGEKVAILKGHKSSRKKIKVGLTEEEVEQKVEKWEKQR
ncbi:MAG: DUF167 family protein [Candidatus Nanohaloarchaea archaeon]